MKKALVLGATGGMGSSIVTELIGRGIEVIAFARTKGKLENLYKQEQLVTIFNGDIFNKEDLLKASSDVDIIFHAANIPYPDWAEKLATLMGNIIEAAKVNNTKLAIVDNIYAYGRGNGTPISEDNCKQPHTKKGKIRLQMEKMVKQSGVDYLICHFPDFYGPNAESTLIHYLLDAVMQNKKAMYVGDQRIAREFIYTPDGAKAMVELSLREDTYGQNWNIPGVGVIKGEEVIAITKELTGYNKKVATATKTMIRLVGLFDSGMREYVEMFYLNEQPVVLSGDKYERLIGQVPKTSYREGLGKTIEYMKQPQAI